MNVSNTLDRPLGVTNGVIAVEDLLLDDAAKDRTHVVALDLHTGQVLWQTWQSPDADALFLNQPVAADGVVYYEIEPSPGHRLLTAAEAATGSVHWSSPLTGTSLAGDPVIDGGLVFAPIGHVTDFVTDTVTTDILALDAATPAARWTVVLGSLAPGPLAAGGGRVYVTTPDGNCWAIDGATGQVAWKFKFDDDQPAPLLLASDTLYFGDGQGRLYALDAATGAQRWLAPLGGAIWRRPAVAGRRVYLGNSQGYLFALDTGSVIWKTQNPLEVPFANAPFIPPVDTEPVVANSTLYFFRPDDLIALRVP